MATLMWAGHTVVLRMSVGEISPVLLMELRWLGSFLILLVLFHKSLPSYLPVVLKHWRWVFGMGGIGLAGFTLFLVYAVQALAWYFIRGFWPQSSPFILVIPVY